MPSCSQSILLLLLSIPSLLPPVIAQPCNVQQPAPPENYCGNGQLNPPGTVTTTCCWGACTAPLSNGVCDVQKATISCTGPTCISVSIGVGDAGSDYTVIQRAALWASLQAVGGKLQGGSACCNAVSCTAGLNSNCVVSGGLPASSVTCPDISTEGTCTITSNTYISCISPGVVVTNCGNASSSSSSSPGSTSNTGKLSSSGGGGQTSTTAATYPTNSASPSQTTTTPSPPATTTPAPGNGLSRSEKIALGTGIPGPIVAIVGLWIAWHHRPQMHRIWDILLRLIPRQPE